MRSHSLLSVAMAMVLSGCAVETFDDLVEEKDISDSESRTPTSTFTAFESEQVRPLALTPGGGRLLAVNTPDNRLEIFETGRSGLRACGSVPVGLEPVAVAARSETEVWVVNHLSDSISIVELGDCRGTPGRVVRTLLVGDEPRDIVFAGTTGERAFITTAHRGQNSPVDPQLTTPGVGRADVWVYDARTPGEGLGGSPLAILTLFTDTPRALAVSADRSRVYAAGFHTGNRTTVLHDQVVAANGGLPPPRTDATGEAQPSTSLIVKFDGTHWLDETGRNFDSAVRFSLPDRDVFAIDANATPPVAATGPASTYAGVGTVLFNMIANPVSGKVYVTNTDARNEHRFEGEGTFAGSTVRGHLVESRITVLDPQGTVTPRHLNKHINYAACCAPIPNAENARSLAFPAGMAITRDGATLYVAGFGSSKIGVYRTRELEADTFDPGRDQIALQGGGPTGLVLDEARDRLYVLTRFDNSIAVVDTRARRQVSRTSLFNPEPASIVNGRRFLYDASYTSSHGDSACASCHIAGNLDSLAWDLGAPDSGSVANPGPFVLHPDETARGFGTNTAFRSLKGPMTTQSLRGLANHGPMHWRGDRTGGGAAPSAQPDRGSFDETAAFAAFNPAFVGLNGRDRELAPNEIRAFTNFILQVAYPPNPIRNLDNSLTAAQQRGRDLYFGGTTDTFFNCNGCHVLDPAGNAEFGVASPGFFGSDGRYSFEAEPQIFKVPHLRNAYSKVGMFGMAPTSFFAVGNILAGNAFTGDQIRGFGFQHDGSVDSVFRFVGAAVFAPRAAGTIPAPPGHPELADPGNPGLAVDADGTQARRDLEAFVMAFDTNLAPIVGQQVTLATRDRAAATARLDLLLRRAEAGECELVARCGDRGMLYDGAGWFKLDRRNTWMRESNLRSLARDGREVTYTCVPPGSGVRVGIDRDLDGRLDHDE